MKILSDVIEMESFIEAHSFLIPLLRKAIKSEIHKSFDSFAAIEIELRSDPETDVSELFVWIASRYGVEVVLGVSRILMSDGGRLLLLLRGVIRISRSTHLKCLTGRSTSDLAQTLAGHPDDEASWRSATSRDTMQPTTEREHDFQKRFLDACATGIRMRKYGTFFAMLAKKFLVLSGLMETD